MSAADLGRPGDVPPALHSSWAAAWVGGLLVQLRTSRARTMTYVPTLLTPPMLLAVLVLTHTGPVPAGEATAKVTGTVLAALWSASLWSGAGVLRRERFEGTLASSLCGVQPPLAVQVGKTAGAAMMDVALIVLSTTVTALALGLPVLVLHPWAVALGLVCVIACGAAASLLVGAALVLSRHAFQLTTALGAPIMLLGGTIVPVSALPGYLQPLSYVINLSWLQRFLASCTRPALAWGALGVAVAISVAYAAAGAYLFGVMLRRARQEATLDLA